MTPRAARNLAAFRLLPGYQDRRALRSALQNAADAAAHALQTLDDLTPAALAEDYQPLDRYLSELKDEADEAAENFNDWQRAILAHDTRPRPTSEDGHAHVLLPALLLCGFGGIFGTAYVLSTGDAAPDALLLILMSFAGVALALVGIHLDHTRNTPRTRRMARRSPFAPVLRELRRRK